MNKKIIYAKALLMVLLILVLPIYVSKAYAATNLNVTRYSGDDNANGYVNEYDRWIFEAEAEIEGDSEITPEQIIINDRVEFQECVPSDGQ